MPQVYRLGKRPVVQARSWGVVFAADPKPDRGSASVLVVDLGRDLAGEIRVGNLIVGHAMYALGMLGDLGQDFVITFGDNDCIAVEPEVATMELP